MLDRRATPRDLEVLEGLCDMVKRTSRERLGGVLRHYYRNAA
jgi:hypothetical protein